MTLFGKDVPTSLDDLQDGINRLFGQVWHSGIQTGPFDGQDCAPPLDVIEKNECYVIEIELPGVAREDVEVSCSDTQLSVRGQKVNSGSKQEGDQVLTAQRHFGSFSRVVRFADPVKSEDMSARLESGVLRIVAPKQTVSSSHVVQVSVEE